MIVFQLERKRKANVKLRLRVNEDLCIGCKLCEATCALTHFNAVNRGKSAIRIAIPPLNGVVVCRQCEDPPCAKPCSVKAISRNDAIVLIDYNKCIGCGLCVKGCIYNSMFWVREQGKPFKCDLCGGNPACLKACPVQAITVGGELG